MKSKRQGLGAMHRRSFLAGGAAATFLITRPQGASAAGWPDKPITVVIMYAAGGGTDVVMRLIAKEMAAAKGWNIEPLNKPGAVGGIATNYVLSQPADGYTLLGAANFNKFVRVMGHTKSKVWEDWTIMQGGNSLASWSVADNSPLKSFDDMLKFAKANPGKLTVSTSGTGGIWHEVGLLISDKLGFKAQFVPYKGGKPATLAGLQGETMIAGGGVHEHIELLRAGKLRNLFHCGSSDIKLEDGKVLPVDRHTRAGDQAAAASRRQLQSDDEAQRSGSGAEGDHRRLRPRHQFQGVQGRRQEEVLRTGDRDRRGGRQEGRPAGGPDGLHLQPLQGPDRRQGDVGQATRPARSKGFR